MARRIRKRGGRRRGGRRVRMVRKGMRLGIRGIAGKGVHTFKESCELVSWSAAASSNTYAVQTFQASNLLNWGAFRGMFDMYKITGVKLTIVPNYNVASVQESETGLSGLLNPLPLLYIAPNRSPWSVAPTSIQDVLNDDGCRIIRLDKKVSLYLKSPSPQILDAVGNGVPLQFNNNTRPWLTTGGNSQLVDQSNVQYYGFRYALQNQFNTNGLGVQVFATYYFKCKEQD